MICILYRKSSISVAFQTNAILRGCNLFIWYGFSDNHQQKDIIIDAAIIKDYLNEDLSRFDHSCISVDSADDIVSCMLILGRIIYDDACKRNNFAQLIVENEYGDYVVILDQRVVIHKRVIFSDQEACFTNTSNSLFSFLGSRPKHCMLSSATNFTNKQLNELLYASQNDKDVDITYIDEVTSTAITFTGSSLGRPSKFSVCCRAQYTHQIAGIPSSEKCSHLHGHTYKCCVCVFNSSDVANTDSFMKAIGQSTVLALDEAFLLKYVQQTTVENVARYLACKLSQSYKLAFVELAETSNIMARITFDD